VHNDPMMRRHPAPISSRKPIKTAIYNPPEDGFPFVAAVFSQDDAILAFRAFPSRREAETFVQAFVQENAGDLAAFSQDAPATTPR
jgi:hypothetical protein